MERASEIPGEVTVTTEAGDGQSRVRHRGTHQRPGDEQEVKALGCDQLADEGDKAVVGESIGERRQRVRGCVFVTRERRCALPVAGRAVTCGLACLRAHVIGEPAVIAQRSLALAIGEEVDIDPRRRDAGPSPERRVLA